MDDKPRGLVLVREVGQSITINGIIDITLTEKVGANSVKMVVTAPSDIHIDRTDKYRNGVEKDLIRKDLKRNSKHRRSFVSPDNIGMNYGKYANYKISTVPSYFLKYVLEQETERSDCNNSLISKIINELEKRLNPLEGSNYGNANNTMQ